MTIKVEDRVKWRDMIGTVKHVVEGDEWPKPYAWVAFDGDIEGFLVDIECRFLQVV